MPSLRRGTGRLAASDPARSALWGTVAGVLVALSVPPFGWWPLGWAGLAVLAGTLPGRRARSRLAMGAAFGLADYIIGLLWVQEFSVPGYIGVVLISTLYSTVALVAVPTGRRRYIAVALPTVLVLADWARDRFPLGGLPLAGLSLGQVAGPLAPTLRLGGSLGLTGETALVGVALAEVTRRAWALRGRGRRLSGAGSAPPGSAPAASGRQWRPVVGVAGVVAIAVALPLAGLVSPSGAGGKLPPLRVGLVQGGGPRGTRAISTDPQVVFDRHLAASAALRPPLDLVVWPEGVLQSHNPYTSSADAAAVAALAVRLHATVLVGVEQDVGATHYLNEVVSWSPQGSITGSYVKNHLVPFGEYIPYRSFIKKYFNIADVPYDAIPGHSTGFLRTPAAPVAIMISYEVFFDERARGGVRAGGQVLVVPTNTASYRSTQVPTQEVAADRMRAWETGRYLVQVTPTGYSTVVGPTGQVLDKTPLDARRVVLATVPRRSGMTVYDHVGDAPLAWAALAGWALALLASARRRRRRATGEVPEGGRGGPGEPPAAGPAGGTASLTVTHE